MTFLKEETWSGQVYSGGWITPEGGTAAVIEPATGNELGRIGIATPADVTRAVQKASEAQRAWAAAPHTERSAILRRAALLWEENAAEIEGWVIRESGKIGPAAQFETHVSVQEIYEAATLPSRPYGELLPSEKPRLSFAERVPVGVDGEHLRRPARFRDRDHQSSVGSAVTVVPAHREHDLAVVEGQSGALQQRGGICPGGIHVLGQLDPARGGGEPGEHVRRLAVHQFVGHHEDLAPGLIDDRGTRDTHGGRDVPAGKVG